MTYLDSFGRPINYLRISVTDRCNLRCIYCMPEEGVQRQNMGDMLTYEEIAIVVKAAAELGVSKVRLTGGEPLARLGVEDLVRMVSQVPGIDDVAMTTNGTLLAEKARTLADAGLRRVNISLDTLDPERFRTITRRGRLEEALAGIEAAGQVGMNPVKVNMVVVRGLNDDEIVRFARLSRDDGWHIRYIEMMPVGPRGVWQGNGHYSVSDIQARIVEELGPLEPASMSVGNGPARYYRLLGGMGTIGFISPVTSHFCGECNRLRLTADGRLRPCLLSDLELDLRSVLRSGAEPHRVQAMIKDAIQLKPKQHHLDEQVNPEGRTMSQIGG